MPSYTEQRDSLLANKSPLPRIALVTVLGIAFLLCLSYASSLTYALPYAFVAHIGPIQVLLALVWMLVVFLWGRMPKKGDCSIIVCAFALSLFWFFSASMEQAKTIAPLFSSPIHLILTLICLAVATVAIYMGLASIFDLLVKNSLVKESTIPLHFSAGFRSPLSRLHCLVIMAVIIVAWLPYLVHLAPGSMSNDMRTMLDQFYGFEQLTTHYPLIAIYLYGFIYDLGRMISGDCVAILCITVFQTLALAFALAYEIRTMSINGAPTAFCIAVIAFFALNPLFASYCQWAVKDTLFAVAFIIYIVSYAQYVRASQVDAPKKGILIPLIVSAFFVSAFRNNGFYVVLLSLPFLAFLQKQGARKTAALLLFTPIIGYLLINSGLQVALSAQSGKIAEAFSLPFQQTALYSVRFPHDITPDEYKAIDSVLDYSALPNVYQWMISDPVKATYKDGGSLPGYFGAWASQGFRHPGTYVDAALLQTYGYFSPSSCEDYAQEFCGYGFAESNHFAWRFWGSEFPQAEVIGIVDTLKSVPILGLIMYAGPYTWLFTICASYIAYTGRRRDLLLFLPIFVMILTCIASPLNGSMRYFLGLIAVSPLVLSFSIFRAREPELP